MNAPGNLHSEVGYFNLQFKNNDFKFFSCNTHKKKIEKSKKLNE